jgi:hypothetical protein
MSKVTCKINYKIVLPVAFIYTIITPKKHRNKGLATKALKELIMLFIYKEVKIIKLTVHPLDSETDYERLVDFYHKFGFIKTNGNDMYLEL